MSVLTSWLLVLKALAPVYGAVSLAVLAADIVSQWWWNRSEPQRTTVWRYVCQHCGWNYERIPYPAKPGDPPEIETTGLCSICLESRHPEPEPIVIDLAAPRAEVAERCAVLRGDAA